MRVRVSINTLQIQETSGDPSPEITRSKEESGHFPPPGSPVTPLDFQLMNNCLLFYEEQLCLMSLSEMWTKSVQTLHHYAGQGSIHIFSSDKSQLELLWANEVCCTQQCPLWKLLTSFTAYVGFNLPTVHAESTRARNANWILAQTVLFTLHLNVLLVNVQWNKRTRRCNLFSQDTQILPASLYLTCQHTKQINIREPPVWWCYLQKARIFI